MGLPAPLGLYALATRLAEPWARGLLRSRVQAGKEDPARLPERLGHASIPRPPGALAWLHGASVGESLSLLPLIEALRAGRPDMTILVTSGTLTSARLLAQRLPPGVIHQFAPVDAPVSVARFLDHWRPALAVLVESELWPNLLLAARARGVRLALLSAKLSDSSYRNWSRFPASAGALFGAFDLILAQDARAKARLTALGGAVAGLADLKFGAAPLPVDGRALAAAARALDGRPLILAASTHPGEDEIVLEAFAAIASHPSAPVLAIAPRHPERGPTIAALARAQGHVVSLASAGEAPSGRVLVADTLGELGLWFRLARLAVMGGGFVPGVGGHNPLEPARLSCPFVSGPMVDNWATAYGELAEAGAGDPIPDGAALALALKEAMDHTRRLADRAERARAYVERRDGEARAVPALVLALAP
ncbi:MAG: glycosyltransferase N-terminal domain-containing protein [Caulobacteraceae bacterium]|nr:glycosyltransferase N-terminal domain-containing protein [Caulobacteraceae bacterium]